MVKIEIKNRFTGSVLFTYEKENATIKDAVEQAVKERANLRYSNLRYSNLIGSNLEGANLEGSNLIGSNLRDSNLRGSNLEGADLGNAKNKDKAYFPMYCKWSHSIIGNKIQIGCKEKTIEEWDSFFLSDETYSTKRDTEEFKQIQAVYLACKAYLTHLQTN